MFFDNCPLGRFLANIFFFDFTSDAAVPSHRISFPGEPGPGPGGRRLCSAQWPPSFSPFFFWGGRRAGGGPTKRVQAPKRVPFSFWGGGGGFGRAPKLVSCSVTPHCLFRFFFLGWLPLLKWSKPQEGCLFFQGH